jgi:hypothetical protein
MNLLYIIVDHVTIPDWLFEAALCEPNKRFIEDPMIQQFTDEHLLPLVKAHVGARPELYACSNHVHIGTDGLTPHDHLPNDFTTVLYLTDAEGELVVDPCGINERIRPVAGRFVIFKGGTVHAVDASPHDELRMSLVTNYEYPTV